MTSFLKRSARFLTPIFCFAAGWLGCTLAAPDFTGAGEAPRPAASEESPLLSAKPGVSDYAPFRWNQIESEDYQAFVSNLRRIGCPEDVVRDLIVCELFCDEHRISTERDGPWAQILTLDPDRESASRIVVTASQVLGYEIVSKSSVPTDQFVPEPLDQRIALGAQIEADFATEHDALWERIGDRLPSTEELEALISLKSARELKLESLFTGAELERYEAERTGQLAEIRQNFAALHLSEDEAVALIRLRNGEADVRQNDEQMAESPDYQGLRQEALRNLLGESRYEDYQRMQDPRFLMLQEIAQRNALPESTTVQAYDMIALGEGRPGVSQSFEVQLKSLLGDSAFEAWLETGETINAVMVEGNGTLVSNK